MRYLSLFSGLGGAELAFSPLGWECKAVSEIDPAACAVLAHHYPNVPNLGDVDNIKAEEWKGKVDLMIGGCPCQSFSVAGLRKSLGDARGNLTLKYVELTHAIDPRWTIFENVPGILSTSDNAFGCFLAGMVGADSELVPARGQRWTDSGVVTGPIRTAAWRILDAQYMGVAQRRRRVFVLTVRGTGNYSCAAALLPLSDCLQRYPPSRKEKWQRVAGTLKGGSGERGWSDPSDGNGGGMVEVAGTLAGGSGNRGWQHHDGAGAFIPFTPSSHGSYEEGIGTLRSNGGDIGGGSETILSHAVTCHHAKGGDPTSDNYVVTGGFFDEPKGFQNTGQGWWNEGDVAGTVRTPDGSDSLQSTVVAFAQNSRDEVRVMGEDGEIAGSLSAETGTHQTTYLAFQSNAGRDFTCDDNCSPPLRVGTGLEIPSGPAVAYQPVGFIHPRQLRGSETSNQVGIKPEADISDALTAEGPGAVSFEPSQPTSGMQVRRLTPVECERLQGIPDNWTKLTEKSADGPRYRMIGNSFAVPVVAWIGKRIQMVEDLTKK